MGHRELCSGLVFWYLNGLVEGGSERAGYVIASPEARHGSPAARRFSGEGRSNSCLVKVARPLTQRFENIPL